MGHYESFAQAHKREHGATLRGKPLLRPSLIGLPLVLLFAMISAGCGARDAAYNPAHFHVDQVIVPPDVSLPPGASAGENIDGLFPIAGDSSSLCCFISPLADLTVVKNRDAHWLQVGTYVSGVVGLQVRFTDGTVRSLANLKEGAHSSRVAVPASFVTKRGNIKIEIRTTRKGSAQNAVSRRGYALILVSLYFE